MNDVTIFPIDRLDLTFAPKPWCFAEQHHADIDAHFAKLQREKPATWNGRVLLLHEHAVSDGVFHGAYLETDFASFIAWRHWGKPQAGVRDCFGAAAILSADGAFLLGVMGPHTVNAGQIYFPCGTPDMSDIVGDQVDLELSVARELQEETGHAMSEFIVDAGWSMATDGALIAQIKLLRSMKSAAALRIQMLAHLKREKQPELSDIRIVRSKADFDPAMPRFVTAYLENYFAVPDRSMGHGFHEA